MTPGLDIRPVMSFELFENEQKKHPKQNTTY